MPNPICHVEIGCDRAKAADFYSRMFDGRLEPDAHSTAMVGVYAEVK